MAATIGALGLAAGGCGTCTAAEPPPPFLPGFTADEALARFRGSPCAGALGEARVAQAGLRGFEGADGPVVFLDLEVTTAPSKLGVRYRTTTSVALVPGTGEVADGAACRGDLATLLEALSKAASAAEATPAVRDFVAANGPADRVLATFESHVQPRGRIVFVPAKAAAPRTPLVWE